MRFLFSAFLITCIALPGAATAAVQLQLTEEHSVDLQDFQAAGSRCGSLDDESIQAVRAPSRYPTHNLAADLEIPVAFHVIYKEKRVSGKKVRIGDLPDSQLEAQIDVLNDAFAGSGFRFRLASVDRKNSSKYFAMTPGSRAEQDAKKALMIDPSRTLNIYTAGPGQNLLGWAYYPWAAAENSFWHGVVLLYSTLPGGSAAPYNLGHTGTHEIGHYLGLYHTFQGGCRAPGDYVNDTPYEWTPAYGCPEARNTCTAAGADPVHNFMDYTDDACMIEFTREQALRMSWAFQTYRPAMAGAARLAQNGAAQPPSTRETPALPILHDATPNPFNPTTTLEFWLPRPAHVSLLLYDIAGREIASIAKGGYPAGTSSVTLQARDLASGVYLAVLRTAGVQQTTRLILLK